MQITQKTSHMAAVTSADQRAQQLALVALFVGAAAIAFAPIFVRLSELEPSATAFYRLLLALPVLWLWHGTETPSGERAKHPRSRGDVVNLIIAGVCFAGDLAVWHWSIRFTTVANATLLANFAPVWVVVYGFVLFGERVTRRFLVGMVLAIAGAGLLMSGSLRLSADHLKGDGLGLITALFYAGYIISVGRLRARMTTASIMAWSGLITCAMLLPVTLVSGESLVPLTVYGWTILAGLALISHAGGQSLIAYALAHLPASFSSVGLLLQPAIAALLAWLLLGETIGPLELMGAMVILAGIGIARRESARAPSAS